MTQPAANNNRPDSDLDPHSFPGMMMTRRGAQRKDKLSDLSAEQRAVRLEEWKKSRTRRRVGDTQSQYVQTDDQSFIEERDIVEDAKLSQDEKRKRQAERRAAKKKDVQKLSSGMLRNFLKQDKWAGMCSRIKQYQEELATITKDLEDQGKPCTGCALKPYHAEFIKKLGEDFKDDEVITAEEMSALKKELNVGSLQVGIRNGKVHVR